MSRLYNALERARGAAPTRKAPGTMPSAGDDPWAVTDDPPAAPEVRPEVPLAAYAPATAPPAAPAPTAFETPAPAIFEPPPVDNFEPAPADKTVKCPACGHIYDAPPNGRFMTWILRLARRPPYRCGACGKRFAPKLPSEALLRAQSTFVRTDTRDFQAIVRDLAADERRRVNARKPFNPQS